MVCQRPAGSLSTSRVLASSASAPELSTTDFKCQGSKCVDWALCSKDGSMRKKLGFCRQWQWWHTQSQLSSIGWLRHQEFTLWVSLAPDLTGVSLEYSEWETEAFLTSSQGKQLQTYLASHNAVIYSEANETTHTGLFYQHGLKSVCNLPSFWGMNKGNILHQKQLNKNKQNSTEVERLHWSDVLENYRQYLKCLKHRSNVVL